MAWNHHRHNAGARFHKIFFFPQRCSFSIISQFGNLAIPNPLASSFLSHSYQLGRVKIMLHHRTAEHMEESTNCSLLHTYAHRSPHLASVKVCIFVQIIYAIVGKSEQVSPISNLEIANVDRCLFCLVTNDHMTEELQSAVQAVDKGKFTLS